MSDKSSENYLDNLLGSISGSGATPAASAAIEEVENEAGVAKEQDEDAFGSLAPLEGEELFGKSTRSEDDEFLRAFEAELESDAYKEYFADFEHEMEEEQRHDIEIETERKSAPEAIASILQGLEDGTEDVSAVPAMPNPGVENPEELIKAMEQHEEEREQLGKLDGLESDSQVVGKDPKKVIDLDALDDLSELDGLEGIEQIGEEAAEEAGETGEDAASAEIPEEEPLKMTEDGEADLSGMSDEDLFSMLANSDEMGDIGDLLDKSDSGESVSDEDAFASYAEKQMEESKEGDEEEAPKKGKKAKKSKKAKKAEDGAAEEAEQGGFFAKLKQIFFGPDDEDEEGAPKVSLEGTEGATAEELMDENMKILQELDGESADKKPEKKKKEKKPKKEKPKKEKKEKPPKEKKPKKEKPPKEVVKLKPLPKGPVIMIFLMVISLMVFIILSTNLVNYSSNIGKANRLMSSGKYTEAYSTLEGMKLKESDMLIYRQAQTLAAVESQYTAFCTFTQVDDHVNAMDALVCAAGRIEINMPKAEEYGCAMILVDMKGEIEKALSDCYAMSMDDALEIYNAKDRRAYTIELHRRLRQLGLE